MMDNYRSVVRQYGLNLIVSVLLLCLMAGCATHEAGSDMSEDTAQTSENQAVENEPSSLSRMVEKIWVNPEEDTFEVWIQGSRALDDYSSIKQTFPFAVTVYISDAGLEPGVDAGGFSDPRVKNIKVSFADEAQTTVRVDIELKRDLPYEVVEDGERLGVILKGGQVELHEMQAGTPGAGPASLDIGDAQILPEDVEIPAAQAQMTHIEFEVDKESGQSNIRIETDHPVRYEASQTGADAISLTLYNTKTPTYHQRPLLTNYFFSAVERVIPGPSPVDSSDTLVDIKIREKVPFQVVQTTKGIYMVFEPSSVYPPEFGKARKNLGSGPQPVIIGQDGQGPGNAGAVAPEPDDMMAQINPGKKVYTGEKVKLDFYETDIKNVFRILKSVGGVNFAIDRDVEGRVTLCLEDPVPWDQILDLVLKMNGLGQKIEGNVRRIAKTETLAREEQERQDKIAAIQKSREQALAIQKQQVALEPLVTKYIRINYSDAKADVEPHVSKILTPDRGKLSVNTRTNMLIITDTQEKIEEVIKMIAELDQVTPQIMIEAKVVEVTKEFSRSFGINWNLANDASVVDNFVDDFSVSINGSSSVGISGAFSFFGLFGSSVTALNAQLEASEEQGDVKIVSSPRILTLDNKKAMIKQGQEYAYLERDDSGGSSVAYKDIDLLLEVTPHVTPDKRISMTVRLTKNDVASVTSDGVPTLATNEAQTELLVNNKETVVIGGVVKSTQSQNDDGIPLLSGIPVLGYLFGSKSKEDDRNELLIFLTPSIVQLEQKKAFIK